MYKPSSAEFNWPRALSLGVLEKAVNNGAVGENRTHDLSLTKR